MAPANSAVEVNGRRYNWPQAPSVVICLDGSERAYVDAAVAAGDMPFLARMLETGTDRMAASVIPSFTNPNNLSIVTGRPPSVHGICGNFFFDREAGEEVMMNDPKFLRAGTIMAGFAQAGASVAVVTAKDKLRRLLGHGLDFEAQDVVAFSAEKADRTNRAEHGIDNALDLVGHPLPDVYSGALSEFVLAAGVELLRKRPYDLIYLSTTDYIQHAYPPGSTEANAFYRMIDGYLRDLDGLGAAVCATADHGMNDKFDADGNPDVIYLQSWLDDRLGAGTSRVILPITDPYVKHHGALGSFATVYLEAGLDAAGLAAEVSELDGIDACLERAAGCERFELPEDRMGDLLAVSGRHKVIGTTPERHDLTQLDHPLRSHGGLTEQSVPMFLNRRLSAEAGERRLRNFDAFELVLNEVA